MKWMIVLSLLGFGFSYSEKAQAQSNIEPCGIVLTASCASGYTNPYVNPYVPYCVACQEAMMQSYANSMVAVQPWWGQQTYMPSNYWNYYAPGPYNGWGVAPQFFPQPHFQTPGGNGGVMLDKPVVYVTGPDHTEVSLSVQPKSESAGMLLATVPALTKSSWKARVEKNQLQTDEGSYEYFFYDARVDEHLFQDQAGFCGERPEVLSYMANGLKTRGFPENSIQEFKSTWSVKLPWHQSLCVYPQTEKELSSGIEIKIEPTTAKLTQLEFVVVSEAYHREANHQDHPKFAKAPSKDFIFESAERNVASAKSEVHVYDWGVGFLEVSKKKTDH